MIKVIIQCVNDSVDAVCVYLCVYMSVQMCMICVCPCIETTFLSSTGVLSIILNPCNMNFAIQQFCTPSLFFFTPEDKTRIKTTLSRL